MNGRAGAFRWKAPAVAASRSSKVWLLGSLIALTATSCPYQDSAVRAFVLAASWDYDAIPVSHSAARAHATIAGPASLSTFTPTAAFRGSQVAIVGGVLGTAAAPTDAFLVRESNCSLTQYNVDAANTITPAFPNADAYLHKLSGSTGAAGAFAKGCGDRVRGVPSAPAVYLGQRSNGDRLGAIGDDTGKITVLRFNAGGSLVGQTVLVAANAANTLAAADLNGDGIADLVTPYMTADGVSGIGVFLGRPDGSFGPATVYPGYAPDVSRFVARVSIDDINGDGKPDIVGIGGSISGSTAPMVVRLLGVGDGSFAAAAATVAPIDTGPFVLADFNGDGRTDLLTAGGLLMAGNGDGSFGPPVQRLNVTPRLARNLAVGDFNGDGKLDVALRDGTIITILAGKGDGTFAVTANYATIKGADYLNVTDLDGDGNADIVVGLTGPGVYGPNVNANTVTQFLLGRGDGTFAAGQALPGAGISLNTGAPTFALADFNADGLADLVYRSPNDASSLVSRLGSTSAEFAAETTVATLGFRPDLVVAADLDGDGKPDLVAAGPSLAVLKGTGNGAFAAAQIYPLPAVTGNLVNLAVGDFNGDGKVDVLVVMGGQRAGTAGAFVYFANADGTLRAPVQIDNATNLRAVAVGDLNGDGRADIAIGGLDPQFYASPDVLRGVRVYRGNGDGTFSGPLTLNPGGAVVAMAIGDLNKDGRNDLVVASDDSSLNETVFVLPGVGDGTFGSASSFPLPGGGPGITSLAIADFNRDGTADVMFAGGSYTGVLLGNGDGTIYGPAALTIGAGASYVIAADLNDDRVTDAVVAVANQGLVPLVRVASVAAAAGLPVPPAVTDFTIALSSSSGSVSSGQSAQTVLTLTFGSGSTQTATFDCTGLPANARCNFSPSSVTPGSAPGSTTVTINTGSASAASGGTGGGGGAPTWGIVGIGSIGAAALVRRRRRPTWREAARLMPILLVAVGLASCGGDDGNNPARSGALATPPGTSTASSTTPSGAYTVAISATAGSITRTALYTLTVR